MILGKSVEILNQCRRAVGIPRHTRKGKDICFLNISKPNQGIATTGLNLARQFLTKPIKVSVLDI
jgi:hypothetical protein